MRRVQDGTGSSGSPQIAVEESLCLEVTCMKAMDTYMYCGLAAGDEPRVHLITHARDTEAISYQ